MLMNLNITVTGFIGKFLLQWWLMLPAFLLGKPAGT
jgi:hypothetical protein